MWLDSMSILKHSLLCAVYAMTDQPSLLSSGYVLNVTASTITTMYPFRSHGTAPQSRSFSARPLFFFPSVRLSQSTFQEQVFTLWLLKVGHGNDVDDDGTITFDIRMHVPNVEALITAIYPNIDKVVPPLLYFLDRVILAPQNTDIEKLNFSNLQRFPCPDRVFYSADNVKTELGINPDFEHIPVEYLCSIDASGLPPSNLHLKIRCPLILL